jgi:hypothetical protein
MVVSLSALRTGRTLLPRNIIILLLVLRRHIMFIHGVSSIGADDFLSEVKLICNVLMNHSVLKNEYSFVLLYDVM